MKQCSINEKIYILIAVYRGEMEPKELLEKLFDEKKLKIINHFLENPNEEFYTREIAKRTRVSVATTFRILNRLTELDIIYEVKMKNTKLYKLKDTKSTSMLSEVLSYKKSALKDFVDQASSLDEIEKIILHGKEDRKKTSVYIIGNNIPTDKVQNISMDIKRKYDFNIMELTFEPDQFEKMSTMGLFSGKKKVLYEK